ncbi:MAG: biotin transporter BioY [Oscillospiraceae bacterium]|nr:biotin transporter BioY [Oscillospiraceae bacterium]
MKKALTTKNLILCALFAALIAIGAFIRVPIPYVPFTLQFMFTLLAGLFLGGKLGALSVLVYILLGLAGVPVFTQGGGPHYIFVPTFGYIIGFLVGTFVCGTIADRVPNPSVKRLLCASLANFAIVYLFGMVYFYVISNFLLGNPTGIWTVFWYCFVIVAPFDALFCVLASFLGKRLIPILRK